MDGRPITIRVGGLQDVRSLGALSSGMTRFPRVTVGRYPSRFRIGAWDILASPHPSPGVSRQPPSNHGGRSQSARQTWPTDCVPYVLSDSPSSPPQDLVQTLLSCRLEVVATSYHLLGSCADKLKRIRFDAVLFDEYHTIKSGSSMQAQASLGGGGKAAKGPGGKRREGRKETGLR